MDKSQAIHSFWSSFGLPAYDVNAVPDDGADLEIVPEMPYITYDVVMDSLGYPVTMNASLWYYSSSWADISKKADQIAEYLSVGGRTIPVDNGIVWITPGNPFAQRMEDPNPSIRRILLNVMTEYLTTY